MLKRYAEALQQDQEAVRLDPAFTEAWVGVSLSAWVLGDADSARRAINAALRLDPRNARALEIQRRLAGVTSHTL